MPRKCRGFCTCGCRPSWPLPLSGIDASAQHDYLILARPRCNLLPNRWSFVPQGSYTPV
jgi:hypothetical protein